MDMKTEYAFTYMERTKMKFKELKPLLHDDSVIIIIDGEKQPHVLEWTTMENLKPEHDGLEVKSVASSLHYDYNEPESRCEIILIQKESENGNH